MPTAAHRSHPASLPEVLDAYPQHRASAPEARILPGLLLTAAIAGAAFALRQLPGVGLFSPMILAIVIGIACHNLIGTPPGARPGVAVALRRLLRLAIILLGLQLTAAQVMQVGVSGIAVIALTLIATFLFTT